MYLALRASSRYTPMILRICLPDNPGTMHTILTTTTGYSVEIEQIDSLGAPWIVRSYRKLAFLRRKLSSDWFLNGEQAKIFAEQLIKDFQSPQASPAHIQNRKPGWTLHRPVH